MEKESLISPRVPRGFQDYFAGDIALRKQMIDIISQVYHLHGFEPLETAAIEYVDVLGKFLPESATPEGGIFALLDDDKQWIALRYDLTAPLSRVVAQYGAQLPNPYRRYQIGPVWRMEKPGPGRFRQFYQCDFDTVGTASPAADAEVCSVLAKAFEALELKRGEYLINVNNRKVLNGVLDKINIAPSGTAEGEEHRNTILRALDKMDRLGEKGVKELLGKGRLDQSGDFTKGAELDDADIEAAMAFLGAGGGDRTEVCARLEEMVAGSAAGEEGVAELKAINALLESMDLGNDQVRFEPSIVRGLAYYTGPVFEAELTFEIVDQDGKKRPFGSVAGGGRYDDLVKRFTGNDVPATGASIGVDRLLAALKAKKMLNTRPPMGPVVVTIMDQGRLADYQQMVAELRTAGIAAELFLGKGGFRKQMKYADKRLSAVAVIAGGDEFAAGQVSLKDLWLGSKLSEDIADRKEWLKDQPAQVSVSRGELVAETRKIIERYAK